MLHKYMPGDTRERIKDLLSEAKMNQEELAEKLGISRSYVSRIEKRALEKLRAALESPSPKRESTLQNRESML